MIAPRDQWAIHVEVTTHCGGGCSNCTRLIPHLRAERRYYMELGFFRRAIEALAEFPLQGPDRFGRRRVVGIMGGEPLLHPEFAELVEIACEVIPDRRHRGLWTGLDWRNHPQRAAVEKLLGPEPRCVTRPQPAGGCGFINENHHDGDCFHQPVLVGVEELVGPELAAELIEACWVQQHWSSSITPQGFFPCEVAAAMDWLFEGPGGVPVSPACWRGDIAEYRSLLAPWCGRCGCPVPLPGRRDRERVDDVSPRNAGRLAAVRSPRLARGRVVRFDTDGWQPPPEWRPAAYLRSAP